MELNKIYNEDCLEGMKRIPDKSIDLIVIDPPYNIGKDKRWDKYKKDEYIEFMGVVFKECERTLKESGSFYWFHNDMMQIKDLMTWLEGNTRFIYKQFIVWNKRFEGAKLKGYLDGHVSVEGLRNYKSMAVYCLFYTLQDETGLSTIEIDKNNFPTLRRYFKELQGYIALNIKGINEVLGHRKAEHAFYWGSSQFSLPTNEVYKELVDNFGIQKFHGYRTIESLREEFERVRYTFNNQRTHHSVWEYEVAPKLGHVTPKPVELIENIIRHSSNPGDVVLDCFMGSGTTAISCMNTERNFIGFELDKTYYKKSLERIKEHTTQTDIFDLI